MKIFITGATGFIGEQLSRELLHRGDTVHAIYRDEQKRKNTGLDKVVWFQGDILDVQSLSEAMSGCEVAFHVAAFTGVAEGNPEFIRRLNVVGTLNVIEAARARGLRRVVVTSTAGVLGPSGEGMAHEDSPAPDRYFTWYERTKAEMEQLVLREGQGLPEVVIVNPTRVYGPGQLRESNGVSRMIHRYAQGKWRFIPGDGSSIGNYVFVSDVVTGHILAMDKGRPGQRYILGGENCSYNDFFGTLKEVSERDYQMFHLPLWLMIAVARFIKLVSIVTGKPPLITLPLVRKFACQWRVSSDKAEKELGYTITPLKEGIKRVLSSASYPL